MHTITIASADKQFSGDIKVGEYVAFWTSDDGQGSMSMTVNSYKTAEAAEAVAQAEGDAQGLEGGSYDASLVVAE